jgi:hypothetical protein
METAWKEPICVPKINARKIMLKEDLVSVSIKMSYPDNDTGGADMPSMNDILE